LSRAHGEQCACGLTILQGTQLKAVETAANTVYRLLKSINENKNVQHTHAYAETVELHIINFTVSQ